MKDIIDVWERHRARLFSTCIRVDIGRDTCLTELRSLVTFISAIRKIPDATSIKPLPLSSKPFTTNHSSITLSSEAMYIVWVVIASLNNQLKCKT